MASVATGAVIHEVLDAIMLGSDRRLIAMLMTRDARKYSVVGSVGVAVRAGRPFAVVSPAVDREVGTIVRRECRARPIREAVATVAGCREARGRVVRIGRVLVFELVATVAIGRGRGVIVADVTLVALVEIVQVC